MRSVQATAWQKVFIIYTSTNRTVSARHLELSAWHTVRVRKSHSTVPPSCAFSYRVVAAEPTAPQTHSLYTFVRLGSHRMSSAARKKVVMGLCKCVRFRGDHIRGRWTPPSTLLVPGQNFLSVFCASCMFFFLKSCRKHSTKIIAFVGEDGQHPIKLA